MEPVEKGLVTAMSIQMQANIISFGQGSIRGELHSRYLEEPFVFIDLVQMIHKMEEIFDTNGFPQAFLSPRSFKSGKRGAISKEVVRKDTMSGMQPNETDGARCTFEINVRFRQNATWQGQILWAEKNIRQNFRSVLEMLKLMDEALSDGDESAKETAIAWGTETK